MSPHLLRCQRLAVDDYSVALGRLEAGATSTFAQSGFKQLVYYGNREKIYPKNDSPMGFET